MVLCAQGNVDVWYSYNDFFHKTHPQIILGFASYLVLLTYIYL